MNVRVRPTVRCTFDEEDNVLRIVLKEAVEYGDELPELRPQELVVYALKVRDVLRPRCMFHWSDCIFLPHAARKNSEERIQGFRSSTGCQSPFQAYDLTRTFYRRIITCVIARLRARRRGLGTRIRSLRDSWDLNTLVV